MAQLPKRQLIVERVSEDSARRVARVIGPNSVAQRALNDLSHRRGNGERVFLAYWKSTYLILPEDCVLSHIQETRV